MREWGGGHGGVKKSKSHLGASKPRERGGGVGGLYDLASALLTLARRQPHRRVERRTPARRWPIPKGIRRRVGRGGGGDDEKEEDEQDLQGEIKERRIH